MVTEKNTATNHDFLKDPILLRRFEKDGRVWIGARGEVNESIIVATSSFVVIKIAETNHQ